MKKLYIALASTAVVVAGAGYFGYQKAHEILTEKAELAVVNSFKQLQQKELVEGAFFASLESGKGYIDIHKPRFILNDGLSKLDIESSGKVRVSYTLLGNSLYFNTSDPLTMKVLSNGVEINKASIVPDQFKLRFDLASALYSLEKGSIKEIVDQAVASADKVQVMDKSGTISYIPKEVRYNLKDERFIADLDQVQVASKTSLATPTEHTALNELIRLFDKKQRDSVVDIYLDFQQDGGKSWTLNKLEASSLPGVATLTAKFEEEKENRLTMDLTSVADKKGSGEYLASQVELLESALDILANEKNAEDLIALANSITEPRSTLIMSGKDFTFFVNVIKNRLLANKEELIKGQDGTFKMSLDMLNADKSANKMPVLNNLHIGTENAALQIEKGLGDLYVLRFKNYEAIVDGFLGFANEILAYVPEAGKAFEEDKMIFTFKLPDATKEQISDVLKSMATVKSSKTADLEIEVRKKGKAVTIGTKPAQAYLPQFMGLGFGMGVALKQQLPEGFLNRFEITKQVKTVGEFGEENFGSQKITTVKVHHKKPEVTEVSDK